MPAVQRRRSPRSILALVAAFLILFSPLVGIPSIARAESPDIVISQVYGGGGNAGATYTHDFIELFNRGNTAVDVTGWSVQYASSAGTTWQKTALSGTIPPGRYYLVRQAQGTGGTTPLPAPDASGTIPMSATAGKVALVDHNNTLSGSCPAGLKDFVGFGTTTNCFEGPGPAPNLSNTTAALRASNGCTDTDSNAADFGSGAPAPRNSGSPLNQCGAPQPTAPAGTGTATPSPATAGQPVTLTVDVTPGTNPASTGISVTADLTALGGSASQAFTDVGGDRFQHTLPAPSVTVETAYTVQATISDAQARTGSAEIRITVVPAAAETGAPVVISQVYGGGGNAGAPYTHDFIELYNRSSQPVSLEGWSVQYASATGNTWNNRTNLTGTLAPGAYYLVHGASSGSTGQPLPPANASGSINLSGSNGKVALVNSTTVLSGVCPADSTVVDFVGYGSANCSETAPAPSLSNATAAIRKQDGQQDTDNNSADFSAGAPNPRTSVVTDPTTYRIRDIQGAAHWSPLNGTVVSGVRGIVTAVRSNGFYMQDPEPDDDPATSEAIFVFTQNRPAVGSLVVVGGQVDEFRPGGDSNNLPITEIAGATTISVISTGNPLPPPVVVGLGGRMPPLTTIDDDSLALFDPANDGIDFWESLESMRVQVNDAVVVGLQRFGEIHVVPDNLSWATSPTPAGGIAISAGDFNPEKLTLDDLLAPTPAVVSVGDRVNGSVVGVIDYSFGAYKLISPDPVTVSPSTFAKESAAPVGPGQLSVAAFNVENLSAVSPASKFSGLAELIVQNLKAPDLITVEEIQDNSGETSNGVVDASQTFAKLIAAIQAAGGPTYDYRQINPEENQDGGAPGGNIRVGFLFRTDRGLSFVDRPGGTATAATTVVSGPEGLRLSYSPGRIDPTNSAFTRSRKPLAGEFLWQGHRLFVVANHFNSKGEDGPLWGAVQPPIRSTEVQRHRQAHVVAGFVSQLLAADPNANVMVLGDLNDFQFSETLSILKAAGLHNPMEALPAGEQYTYVFDGNSQALDHMLLSSNLLGAMRYYDIVHVNAGFADQLSDHDPQVIHLSLNAAPTVSAGGPYTVNEGSSITLTASGADLEGQTLAYAWDLDGNGTFETEGQTVTFDAAALDGPFTRTVTVQVTDAGGMTASAQATVTVQNVAPAVGALALPPVLPGTPVTATASFTDPGAADTFTATWDWGDGTSSAGTVSGGQVTGEHVWAEPGIYTVTLTVTDDDGGSGSSTATVVVAATEGALTAGGWIGLGEQGKANLAVTARYQKGQLTGQMLFDAGGLKLRATGLDWLVVQESTAYLQGTATVDGAGEYRFLFTLTAGQENLVSLLVWSEAGTLFDNRPGTPLGGGAIQIRAK